MRKMILGDTNMSLNHITERLEYKHTCALWLPPPSLLFFPLPSFIFHPDSTSLASLVLSLRFILYPSLAMCLSRLPCSHPIMECFPEDLTLWGYCVRKMILISAHSAELSCKLPFPHGDAAKLTGTNSLWHTIAWVLRDCICFLERGDLL